MEPRLQLFLMNVVVAGGANVEADALVLLLPSEDRMSPEVKALRQKLKVSNGFVTGPASTSPRLASKKKRRKDTAEKTEKTWWMDGGKGEEPKVSVVKLQKHPKVTVPKMVAWNSHAGVLLDLVVQKEEAEEAGAAAQAEKLKNPEELEKSFFRNAVLCIMTDGPLTSLACQLLIKFRPDESISSALLQYAASTNPVNADAILAGTFNASEEALTMALEGLLTLPMAGFETRVCKFYNILRSSSRLCKWAYSSRLELRKLLASRGGMTWDAAENAMDLLEAQAPVEEDYDDLVNLAVQKLQLDDEAKRAEAYDEIFRCWEQLKPEVQEMVLMEWRLASQNPDVEVVKDSIKAAASLHVLAGDDKVREWLFKTHGPRSCSDLLRAFLIIKGFAN
jgi:hypothetical protein